MKVLLKPTKKRPELSEDARGALSQNLRALMAGSRTLTDRPTLAKRSGVAARTIGSMAQGDGNPTLANVEAVATAYGLELWEILNPSLNVKEAALNASESEKKWQRQIEAAMKKLGVKKYRIPGDDEKD